jgi:hypothetical protein
MEVAAKFFDGADPHFWIRGKFLVDFMRVWISIVDQIIRNERQSSGAPTSSSNGNFTPATLDIRSLASRCELPPGLCEFALAMAA